MPQKLQCFLYHSELDPAALVACVPDIIKEARRFNAEHQITGVLMFDGHRFAQYLEGMPEKVDLLIDKLANGTPTSPSSTTRCAPVTAFSPAGPWPMYCWKGLILWAKLHPCAVTWP